MGIIQDIQKTVDKGIKDAQKGADAALGQLTGATGSNTSGKGSPSISSTSIPTSIDLGLPKNMDFSNFGSLDYSTPTIPTPNFDFSVNMPEIQNLTPNWDQLQPNLNQDLTKLNPENLQSAAVDLGTDIQREAVNIGSAVQTAATDAGSALQQNLIDVGSSLQQTAIDLGSLTGMSNPTLEAEAERWTSATETNIQSIADWAKANEQGFTNSVETNVEGFTKSLETNIEGFTNSVETNVEGAVSTIEDLKLPLIFNFFEDDKKWKGPDGTEAQPLPEVPTLDDNKPFEDIETTTTKADQMTEEERLRRIRRLMLNRYGREDTILTGTADTTGRRRTAPGFMGM